MIGPCRSRDFLPAQQAPDSFKIARTFSLRVERASYSKRVVELEEHNRQLIAIGITDRRMDVTSRPPGMGLQLRPGFLVITAGRMDRLMLGAKYRLEAAFSANLLRAYE